MDEETHITTDRARAGETPHIVRYILNISVVVAALALGAVVLWYASSNGDSGSNPEDARFQRQPDSVPKSPEYLRNGVVPPRQ